MADGSLVEAVLGRTAELVAAVGDDHLSLPTPCPAYDVGALVAHMVERLHDFGLGGAPASPVAPADALTSAAARAAAMADGVGTGHAVVEYVTHGWDLAIATGQAVPYTAPEAAAALRLARELLVGEERGPGRRFGPMVVVPRSAPPIDRLAGLTGRRPGGAL